MTEYFSEMLSIIEESVESIDGNSFECLVSRCDDVLNHGGSIIVTGLGKNVPICDKFVGTMVSLGMRASFLHTNSAVHGDIGTVHSGDLVIILTKSGETAESIYLTQQLKKRQVELWLLSFTEDSTLRHKIDNCLILSLRHEGDMWDLVPNNSTTMNLIVLQALAIVLAKRRNVSIEEFKRNHPGGHIGVLLENR